MNRGAALQRQRLFSCVSREHVEFGSRHAVLAAGPPQCPGIAKILRNGVINKATKPVLSCNSATSYDVEFIFPIVGIFAVLPRTFATKP
jgi:hypothetical protein